VVSCEKYGEKPVGFDIYFNIVPENEMEEMRKLLNDGITP
jgi:hypothetical protein